jgi:hypothetical protein
VPGRFSGNLVTLSLVSMGWPSMTGGLRVAPDTPLFHLSADVGPAYGEILPKAVAPHR